LITALQVSRSFAGRLHAPWPNAGHAIVVRLS
jgi:hypothetical protein